MIRQILFATTSYYTSSDSSSSNTQSGDFLYNLIQSMSPLLIAGLIIVIIWLTYFIRWWMVQSTIFSMQQDIYEIKYLIAKGLKSQATNNLNRDKKSAVNQNDNYQNDPEGKENAHEEESSPSE